MTVLLCCPHCDDPMPADGHDAVTLLEDHVYLVHEVLPALEPRRAR